jgi:hypothetical protein
MCAETCLVLLNAEPFSDRRQRKMRPKADKKLLKVIRKKKISLGYKYDDITITPQ